MCVEDRGRISRSGLTQDIKMGSFQVYSSVTIWLYSSGEQVKI